jgi:uncharacterized tellurite resistance protein B-like protein
VRISHTGDPQEKFIMMSMQAREMCTPFTLNNQVLRTYASNSPRAKARLLVLAMLADGRLDDAELETLARQGMFAKLGIAREDFFEVLYDFCADMEKLPRGGDDFLLSPLLIEQLFGEINSAGERQTVLRLIFDMIRSDGHLAESEADLFWQAVDTWKLHAADTQAILRGKHRHQ